MKYIEGFVSAVPTANKERYRKHIAMVVPILKELVRCRLIVSA